MVKNKIKKTLHKLKSINVQLSLRAKLKIASLGREEPQPAGTAKWQTTLRFGETN